MKILLWNSASSIVPEQRIYTHTAIFIQEILPLFRYLELKIRKTLFGTHVFAGELATRNIDVAGLLLLYCWWSFTILRCPISTEYYRYYSN